MPTVVDSLLIQFGLDSKGVDQGMKKAESSISAGVKKITSILGPIVGAAAFKGLLDNYTQTADSLGKMADRIGVSITELDAWGMAAEDAGGSAAAFQSTIEGLNAGITVLGKTGAGRLKAPLEALGISAKNAAGEIKQPFEVLTELAAKAHDMDAAQFAGLAAKLGLDKGTIALLQQGDQEVLRLVKDMEKYAYTQKDAIVSAQYTHAMQFLQRAFQKVAATILREVVPALSWLAEKFTSIVVSFGDNKATLVAAFIGVAAVIGSKVIPALKNMDMIWAKSKSLMTISAIVAGITAIYLVIDDFITYCEGGQSALEDLWSVFGTGEEITQWFSETLGELKEIGTEVFGALQAGAALFSEYFGGAIAPLKAAFMDLFGLIKSLFTGDFEGVMNHLIGLLGNLAQVVVTVLTGAFQAVFDAGKRIFSALWDWIKGLFGKLGDAVFGGIKSLVAKLPDFLLPDSVKAWATADSGVKTAGAALAASGEGVPASAAEAAGETNISNDNHKDVKVESNVTVYANGTDGEAIGSAVSGKVEGTISKAVDGSVGGPGV